MSNINKDMMMTTDTNKKKLAQTCMGLRAFPVAGPRLWNSLPSNLRQSDHSDLTLQQFRWALKTYLSAGLAETPAPSDVLFVGVLYKCSHLFTY